MGLAHLVALLPGVIIGLIVAIPAFLAGLNFAHKSLIGFISLSLAIIAIFGLTAIALAPYLQAGHATPIILSAYPLLGIPVIGFIIAGIIDGMSHREPLWPAE